MPVSASSLYYNAVNPDVLVRIPVTARHVLEVGCGAGALGARFRLRAPVARWSGIELVPDVAERASAVLDQVLCADIEDLTDGELDAFLAGHSRPDVLVFADVLEHLKDPERTLARLVSRIATEATVVACIPNISHWSIIEGLLRGDWTYADQGLLDRTHLRFYTPGTAVQLLRGAGLNVFLAAPRKIPLSVQRRDRLLGALGQALDAVGVNATEARARMDALQYVLVAAKPPLPDPIHVHHTLMVTQLHEARMQVPAEAMAALPGVFLTQSIREAKLPNVPGKGPRILVVQRQLVRSRAEWLAAMARIAAQGWLIVAEWDDHPSLLPQPARAAWQAHPWLPFSGTHAVQVSTPLLADALREHNPEIAVLPNAMLELPVAAPRAPGTIRVVCAAMSRPGLEGLVAGALDAAAGADPRVHVDIVADQVLFDALRTDRKRLHPLLSYAAYLQLLSEADISVMPIRGDAPERYKSPLKFLEGASRGAACIGSPVLYAGVIEDGVNGLLAETPAQWTQALLKLIADDDMRRTIAANGWLSVRDRHLQAHHVGQRRAWYMDLWARRHELRAALHARHPEFPVSAEV
jgi:SAM-dependent methyltransferase